jgi:hypothetical protein
MTEDKLNIGCKYFESWEFDRIKCKVRFYSNCGIFRKVLFALIHGRNFVPTQNEKHLVYLYDNWEKL